MKEWLYWINEILNYLFLLMIIYDKLYISEILYWVSMRVCNENKIELECSLYGVKINN
jgi:hypothetical protein